MKTMLFIAVLAAGPVSAAELAPVPAQPATTPPSAAPAPAAATGSVARAQFTSAVQDREPTDQITTLGTDKTQISFFTELKDLANHKVTHRWEHNGQTLLEISFDVGGDRWRVYSTKTLDPSSTGEWKVSVIDQDGGTLGAYTFAYEAPAATPTSPPAPAAPSTP